MAGEMSLGKILIEFGVEIGDLKAGLAQVTDQLKQQEQKTESAGSSLSGMAQKWFFVKNAIQDVAGVAKEMLQEWSNQERAVNQLNLSLANQGNLLPGTTAAMLAQATALQQTTIFADEAITAGQAFLAQQGKSADEIMAATPAILDMASAMGIDVERAFMMASKAAAGNEAALSKYGIKVAENIPESQKFGAIIEQLGQRFGGMSEIIATDAIGRMQQFNNAIGEVKEGIGKFVEFTITSLTGGIQGQGFPILDRLAKFFAEDLIIYLGMARQGFANMVASILEGAAGIGTAVSTISGWFGSTFGQAQVEQLKLWAQGFRDAGQALYDEAVAASVAGPGNEALTQTLLNQSLAVAAVKEHTVGYNFNLSQIAVNVATAQAAEAALAAQRQAALEAELAADQARMQSGIEAGLAYTAEMTKKMQGDLALAESAKRLGVTTRSESAATLAQMTADYELLKASGELTTDQLKQAWEKLETFRRESTGETTSFAITSALQLAEQSMGAFSQIGSQFKAFAIAQGIISTYLAIARALAAPWPASLVFAAQAAAMGWATVNKIRGTSAFAHGTPGLDFANFGKEQPAMLHGREAVIPQGGGHALADEIASSLGRAVSAPTSMAMTREAGGGGTEGSGGGTTQNIITLDGKILAEWYENASKRGAVRTHTIAVKEF